MEKQPFDIEKVIGVMTEASTKAGFIIQKRYGNSQIVSIFNQYHIKLDVDIDSHLSIVETVIQHFPDAAIFSEESENTVISESDNVWIIDPLEGTSNYSLSIPYYGVSLSYFFKHRPVVTCLFELSNNALWIAADNRETVVNNRSILMAPFKNSIEEAVISVVVDYTKEGLSYSNELIALFSQKSKRVMTNWAPTIDLSRVAMNLIDIFICLETPFENICAGLFFVQQAGGTILNYDGSRFDFLKVSYDDKVSLLIGSDKSLLTEIAYILTKEFRSYSPIL